MSLNEHQRSPTLVKWSWTWGTPLILVGLAIGMIAVFAIMSNNLAFNESITQRAELPRKIESFEAGPDIIVTDIRTGTEFTRIIRGPNGQIVVRSGWVNRWGEHQLRTRDDQW